MSLTTLWGWGNRPHRHRGEDTPPQALLNPQESSQCWPSVQLAGDVMQEQWGCSCPGSHG